MHYIQILLPDQLLLLLSNMAYPQMLSSAFMPNISFFFIIILTKLYIAYQLFYLYIQCVNQGSVNYQEGDKIQWGFMYTLNKEEIYLSKVDKLIFIQNTNIRSRIIKKNQEPVADLSLVLCLLFTVYILSEQDTVRVCQRQSIYLQQVLAPSLLSSVVSRHGTRGSNCIRLH